MTLGWQLVESPSRERQIFSQQCMIYRVSWPPRIKFTMQNCYNKSKRTPKVSSGKGDEEDSQDERLTTKHINTLHFLQDVANENKELKSKIEEYEEKLSKCAEIHSFAERGQERIKEIQEQYLQRADEINAMLNDKHQIEMMKKVEEHVEAEKQWTEEKHKLLAEIATLKSENKSLIKSTENSMEHRGQIEILELKVASLQQEIDRLSEENENLKDMNTNQLAEIQRLQGIEALNRRLTEELTELEQKKRELEFKLSRAESANSQKPSYKEEVLSSLQAKLGKILDDKTAMEVQVKEKLRRLEVMDTDNANLRKALADSERMRTELKAQLDAVMQELSMLKHQINTTNRDKQTFKDFVQLKRDFANLKAENDELKSRLKARYGSGSLPALKEPQITAVKSPVTKSVSRRDSKDSLSRGCSK